MDRRDKLIEAGVALASELSLSALLQRIVDVAVEITEARYGALGVLGPDGRLSGFITHGVTEEDRWAIGEPPVGRGILGMLMEEARPLRISDISSHPRSVGFPEHHPSMTTLLGAPIVSHGEVFGDLYLTDKRGGGEFTAEDEEAVVVLAAQASVAIENARLYEETRRREAWLEAVREISTAILAGASTDETLRLIARRARELVSADLATLAIPDPTGTRLTLKAADGARAGELYGSTFPMEGFRLEDFGPTIIVPLVDEEGEVGRLLAANLPGGRAFGPDEVRLLETFADQAALAFGYSSAQEERRRIARDLHDGVAQELAFVARRARRLAVATDDPGLHQIVAAAERGLTESRRQLAALTHPLDEPLDAALARAVEEIAEREGAHVELDLAPGVRVGYEAREGLIRIACEAVSNAIRHAHPSTIRVALTGGDAVRLTIDDDGAGFDPASVVPGPGSGFGLTSMRERAESMGARFRLDSRPGAGTELEVVLG